MDEERRFKEEQSQQELNFMRENMQAYEKEVLREILNYIVYLYYKLFLQ